MSSITPEQSDRIENPLDASRIGWDRGEYGDGRFESGFFGGNKPAWHGLGNVLADDVLTAARAIEAADLDWEVVKQPLYVTGTVDGGASAQEYYPLETHTAIGRVKDGEYTPFGVVGRGYTIVQNKQAFQFMDDLVGSSEAKYHTAMSLRGGRRVCLLARVPHADIRIGGLGDDELIHLYLLLSNGHDGSGSLRVDLTPVRVVCENTQTLAIQGALRSWTTRHTTNVLRRMHEARRTLELTFRYTAQLQATGERMAAAKLDAAGFERFLRNLVPLRMPGADEQVGDRAAKNREETQQAIRAIYQLSPNLGNVRGTTWGALQAVAEYADHGRLYQGGKLATAAERRFEAATTGGGLKQRAYQLLQ